MNEVEPAEQVMGAVLDSEADAFFDATGRRFVVTMAVLPAHGPAVMPRPMV
jgi:hypothetical protein